MYLVKLLSIDMTYNEIKHFKTRIDEYKFEIALLVHAESISPRGKRY